MGLCGRFRGFVRLADFRKLRLLVGRRFMIHLFMARSVFDQRLYRQKDANDKGQDFQGVGLQFRQLALSVRPEGSSAFWPAQPSGSGRFGQLEGLPPEWAERTTDRR